MGTGPFGAYAHEITGSGDEFLVYGPSVEFCVRCLVLRPGPFIPLSAPRGFCSSPALDVVEYSCTGYVNMDAGLSFLFTRDLYGDSYSCWVRHTHSYIQGI